MAQVQVLRVRYHFQLALMQRRCTIELLII
jgi:hypothetical protein